MASTRSGLQRAVDRYLHQYASVRETQQALLTSMVRRNAATTFGKEHGFGSIAGVRDFQRQVPIRQWADFSGYVDAVVEGRSDVLTKEAPFFFQRTTGTTGTPKMIPFTRRCQANARLTHGMWIYKTALDNPGLLKGRVMAILNAGIDGFTPLGQAFGSVSGNVFYRMPDIVRRAYSHPYDIYHIPEVEARRYALLRFALHRGCTFAFTGNPSSLLALFEFADKHSETLLRDIHDGTLSAKYDIPDSIRVVVLNDLLPNRRRARSLAKAREAAGRLKPVDYWPELKAIGCWIGGSMGHFAPQLREWCGESFSFRDVGYMASEGVFTMPLANDTIDGPMALHATFFEFVAEREFGRPDASPLLAHEIESGQNYHVVITTTGGLYRYAMNDVVRAGRSADGSPTLRFLYKGSNVQNIQGEMVTVDHVMGAVAAISARLGIRLQHFQVVADLEGRRYMLYIEPSQELPRQSLEYLLSGFDDELAKLNENYQMFRADQLIAGPALRVMRRDWFARISQDHLARSGRDSQFKPAVLAAAVEHPEMAEIRIDWFAELGRANSRDVSERQAEG